MHNGLRDFSGESCCSVGSTRRHRNGPETEN